MSIEATAWAMNPTNTATLSDGAWRVLACMANMSDPYGLCLADADTIAASTNRTPAAVVAALAELEAHGAIRRPNPSVVALPVWEVRR